MIAAPGDEMNVHEQNPPTDLTIFLSRAKYIDTNEQFILPDPLNDPIIEQLVKRRTAETYEVKAGEYIQIIDPGGRQCSDFLAFDTHKLNEGIERMLNEKATRTIRGSEETGPG